MFKDTLNQYSWEQTKESITTKTEADVRQALSQKSHRTLEDFKAMISPAAAPFLEEMARQSQALTLQRFGKTMQMYIPLYVSNECQNICTYCGFSLDNPLARKTLSDEELINEAKAIKKMGFEHVLLVSGEAQTHVGLDYFKRAFKLLRPFFAHLSIEVQPLEQKEYEELIQLGLHTVLIYQETYRRETYKSYHPKGKKSLFDYRLETPERLGQAGIYKMGLGCLIGLEDWRVDSFFTALHLNYLEKKFWKTRFSLSFPRLRPFTGSFEPNVIMEDKELVQLICAYRLFNQDLELSLSTRESQYFRDHVMGLGITSVSAGSQTAPGGYSKPDEALEQFEISDERSPQQMSQVLQKMGYESVWKDWDVVLS